MIGRNGRTYYEDLVALNGLIPVKTNKKQLEI